MGFLKIFAFSVDMCLLYIERANMENVLHKILGLEVQFKISPNVN